MNSTTLCLYYKIYLFSICLHIMVNFDKRQSRVDLEEHEAPKNTNDALTSMPKSENYFVLLMAYHDDEIQCTFCFN